MWPIARDVRVFFHDTGYRSIRIGSAYNGNGAAAAATRNPGAVKTRFRTARAHEIHNPIRPRRSQTARRVTCMRLIHELAEAPELRFPAGAPQQVAEFLHSAVLINRMRGGLPDLVHALGIDDRYCIRCPGITAKKLSAGHFIGQGRSIIAFKVFHGNIRQVPVEGFVVTSDHPQAHEGAAADGAVVRTADGVTLSGIDSPKSNSVRNLHRRLQLGRLAKQRKK